ncbi:MAG: prepilin-type N-terminal cleavage/methylation domain-containing protein [Clostridiales bacterium]|nr:prepilin-type N-terminal cleavage/methylation domain-containing protein [Clostridiales bacterium]
MIKAKKKFNIALGSAKKSKAGFSLVELIVAVAILAAVIAPIMHTFVTSARTSTKAQKIGERTDMAFSILGLLNSTSVKKFQECDEGTASLLQFGDSTVTLRSDPDNTVLQTTPGTASHYKDQVYYLTGLEQGSSKFDARVTMTLGKEGVKTEYTPKDEQKVLQGELYGFYNINTREIKNFEDPDGFFAQPADWSLNPDNADYYTDKEGNAHYTSVFNAFYAAAGQKKYDDKERVIIVDVTENDNKVYTNITYHYLFTYSQAGQQKFTVVSRKYSVFSGGVEKHENGAPVSAYIMYYPFYKQTSQGIDLAGVVNDACNFGMGTIPSNNRDKTSNDGVVVPFETGKDIIIINNRDDIAVKFYFVKQWKLNYEYSGEKDDIVKGKTGEEPLCLLENQSLLTKILEVRSSISEALVQGFTVYTNAGQNLPVEQGYNSVSTTPDPELWVTDNTSLVNESGDNQRLHFADGLVDISMVDRIYYVNIELFEKDTFNIDAESGTVTVPDDAVPLYETSGSAALQG